MIAVVGLPLLAAGLPHGSRGVATGLAAAIARAAAEAGAGVQLVGKVGDDPEGDAVLLDLGVAGIGHAATLRDAGHRTPIMRAPGPDTDEVTDEEAFAIDGGSGDRATDDAFDAGVIDPADAMLRPAMDAADLELALRYLPDLRVVVLVEPGDELVPVAVTEAAANVAHLIVVMDDDAGSGRMVDALPADALVLAPPSHPGSAGFAGLVGRYAAAVDGGTEPRAAFDATLARLAGAPASG